MLRDCIVCGIWEDDVRHKLLAKPKLKLEDVIQLCRAEKAVTQTNVGIPTTCHLNLARRQQSAYQKAKVQQRTPSNASAKPGKIPHQTPAQCYTAVPIVWRKSPHEEPLSSQAGTILAFVARRKDTFSQGALLEPHSKIGRLQVRALQTNTNTITVDTNCKLSMAEALTPLTGSRHEK